jgi:hypothetical protein
MNKLKSTILRAVFILMALTGYGTPALSGGVSDAKITSLVGAHVIEVLKAPDQIDIFELGPMSTGQGGGISGYSIVRKLETSDRLVIAQLLSLALDDQSHVFDIQKKCRFRPNTGIRVSRQTDHVNVLLAMDCKQWMFDSGDKQIYGNFDPVDATVTDIIRQLYGEK